MVDFGVLTRNAVVASASSSWNLRFGCNEGCLGLRRNTLWCNGLSSTVDDLAILNETLDQPVVITSTDNPTANTALAEIKVTIIADAAVIVYVWDGIVAIVAVDRVYAHGWACCLCHGILPESRLAIGREAGNISKPLITSAWAPSDWDLGVIDLS